MGNARLKSCRVMEPCVRFFVPCITDKFTGAKVRIIFQLSLCAFSGKTQSHTSRLFSYSTAGEVPQQRHAEGYARIPLFE